MGRHHHPPAALRALLLAVLDWDERDVASELDELYTTRQGRSGPVRARLWYLRQVAGFVVRMGWRRCGRAVRESAGLTADLRVALRTLRRRPGYAAAFAGTLTLAVGAVATVHAAAHHVLLRPVPGVTDGDDIVTLRIGSSVAPAHISWPLMNRDLNHLSSALSGLAGLAGVNDFQANLVGLPSGPTRAQVALVSAAYFDVLGTRLTAGSVPAVSAGDEAVVSHRLAQTLGGSPAGALGARLEVDGRTFRVAGVAPRGFRGHELPDGAEVWLSAAAFPVLGMGDHAGSADGRYAPMWDELVGRLAPGSDAAAVRVAARATMARLIGQGEPSGMAGPLHFRLDLHEGAGLDPGVRTTARRTLLLLAGAAAFLLLIALANLGSLALAHAAAQRPAHALRRALGAGRGRVARALLVEGVLLGATGAAAGLVVAELWSRRLANTSLARTGAELTGMGVGPVVAAGALAVAVGVSVVALLLPAVRSGRVAPVTALQTARHGDVSAQRLRALLVVVQAAAAVALIVGAGLLVRTVGNLAAVPLGFAVDDVILFQVDPDRTLTASERVALLERLEERLRTTPGVTAAGFSNYPFFSGGYITNAYAREPQGELEMGVAYYETTPGLLAALRPQLLAGRADNENGEVVVSRGLATTLFPGVPVAALVGRSIFSPQDDWAPRRIAGVVDDLATSGFAMRTPAVAFVRYTAETRGDGAQGWLHAPGLSPGRARSLIERAVAQEANLPVFQVEPARATAARLHTDRTALAETAVAVGLFGLLLTAVGLYGVLAYMVVERRREIGVRAALGAEPEALLADVLKRGLGLALAGGIAGLLAATFVGRLLRNQLYGLGALDTPTYVAGMLTLLAVALAASWLPARRATRVDPLDVLRDS